MLFTNCQVNEGIIGTCSELMAAVRLLIIRASDLQKEIVAAGNLLNYNICQSERLHFCLYL